MCAAERERELPNGTAEVQRSAKRPTLLVSSRFAYCFITVLKRTAVRTRDASRYTLGDVVTRHGAEMRRLAAIAAAVTVFMLVLSGCGGSHNQTAHRSRTAPSVPLTPSARASEVLSLSGLGTFEGRCPRGARSWTLRFFDNGGATDTVSYRVRSGARHTVNVGNAITFHLVPDTTRTHEPADRFVPPIGQGRGRSNAMSVPSTLPIDAVIYQGTEPQTLRADVHLALSSIGGESGQCVLVGSSVHAYTYPNG
jgi:hypothetical protein